MDNLLKNKFESGFESKIKFKKNFLILALKYAHIARRSYYFKLDKS